MTRKLQRNFRNAAAAALAAALAFTSGCASVPTVAQERQLGKQVEAQARAQHTELNDPVVAHYISQLGAEIVAAAGPLPYQFSFTVVENETPNAFVLPGGAVFINSGMILAARNVSELAGVLAHEVGHVAERHVAENMANQQNANLVRNIAMQGIGGALGGGSGAMLGRNAASILSGVAAMAYVNNYKRDAEREADQFAVKVLPQAGIDPTGVVSMFKTLQSMQGARKTNFLSSHPAPKERITATQALAARSSKADSSLRQDDGGKLEIIQRRIRLLTGAAGAAGAGAAQKPPGK